MSHVIRQFSERLVQLHRSLSLPLTRSLAKKLGPDYCGICSVSFPDERSAWEHYESPDHKKRLVAASKMNLSREKAPEFWVMVLRTLEAFDPNTVSKVELRDFMINKFGVRENFSLGRIEETLDKNLTEMADFFQTIRRDGNSYGLKQRGRQELLKIHGQKFIRRYEGDERHVDKNVERRDVDFGRRDVKSERRSSDISYVKHVNSDSKSEIRSSDSRRESNQESEIRSRHHDHRDHRSQPRDTRLRHEDSRNHNEVVPAKRKNYSREMVDSKRRKTPPDSNMSDRKKSSKSPRNGRHSRNSKSPRSDRGSNGRSSRSDRASSSKPSKSSIPPTVASQPAVPVNTQLPSQPQRPIIILPPNMTSLPPNLLSSLSQLTTMGGLGGMGMGGMMLIQSPMAPMQHQNIYQTGQIPMSSIATQLPNTVPVTMTNTVTSHIPISSQAPNMTSQIRVAKLKTSIPEQSVLKSSTETSLQSLPIKKIKSEVKDSETPAVAVKVEPGVDSQAGKVRTVG